MIYFSCNGIRWTSFSYLHQQFTVLMLCTLATNSEHKTHDPNTVYWDFEIWDLKLIYYSNVTFQSFTQNKLSLVKMLGLLNATTKVATGCLRMTKDSTFAVFLATRLLYKKYEKYVTLSIHNHFFSKNPVSGLVLVFLKVLI